MRLKRHQQSAHLSPQFSIYSSPLSMINIGPPPAPWPGAPPITAPTLLPLPCKVLEPILPTATSGTGAELPLPFVVLDDRFLLLLLLPKPLADSAASCLCRRIIASPRARISSAVKGMPLLLLDAAAVKIGLAPCCRPWAAAVLVTP
jgi:hypothetical protein